MHRNEIEVSKMSINKDKLIRMMYERPIIWNHKHLDYRSGAQKQQAWVELAVEFHMTDEELKKKWACIRDTFRRELRKILKLSTETSPWVSKWPYFEKMLFLKDTMDARKSFIDETEAEDDDIEIVETKPVFSSPEKNDTQSPVDDIPYTFGNFQIVPRKLSIVSDALAYACTDNEANKKRSAKLAEFKESPGEKIPSPAKKKPNDIEDDDYHFVMSILPTLRKVSNKMKVRMDIMNLILSADKK